MTPEHLMCPITHSLMRWPAMAADGHVYEHLAIRRWLLDSTTSPMTGAKLRSALLVPVVPLRIICDAVVAELDADKLQELEDQVTFFSILCDRLLDRLCARIHACTRCAFTYEDPAGADAARQRWVLDMDGDSPEDVARMLVCTARDRCASRSVGFESTLAALERVACVSKKAVAQSGAVECAIAALQSEAGRPPPGVAEAALSVIARAGGGVDPKLAIASVLGELDRAGGLAALAAVLPGASADEMRGCVASVLGKLLDRIPDTAAAAMRPGSVLVAGLGDSPIAHQVINCSVKPTKLAHKSFKPIFTRFYLSTQSIDLFCHSACRL